VLDVMGSCIECFGCGNGGDGAVSDGNGDSKSLGLRRKKGGNEDWEMP